jgi:hypothetical protein
MRVWGADDCWLPSVSLVADNQLSDGNFVFQTFRSKDANVISTSGKWTFHPNQFFVVYGYSQFIVQSSLVELVRIVCRIF